MDKIEIETLYGANTRKSYVRLRWGKESGQLTPDEAREHALKLLDAAAVAEQDELTVRFFMEKMESSIEQAAMVLQDFRKLRDGNG